MQIEPGSIPSFQLSRLISVGKSDKGGKNTAICTATISIQTQNEVEIALYYTIDVMRVRDENGKRRYENHVVLFFSLFFFFYSRNINAQG